MGCRPVSEVGHGAATTAASPATTSSRSRGSDGKRWHDTRPRCAKRIAVPESNRPQLTLQRSTRRPKRPVPHDQVVTPGQRDHQDRQAPGCVDHPASGPSIDRRSPIDTQAMAVQPPPLSGESQDDPRAAIIADNIAQTTKMCAKNQQTVLEKLRAAPSSQGVVANLEAMSPEKFEIIRLSLVRSNQDGVTKWTASKNKRMVDFYRNQVLIYSIPPRDELRPEQLAEAKRIHTEKYREKTARETGAKIAANGPPWISYESFQRLTDDDIDQLTGDQISRLVYRTEPRDVNPAIICPQCQTKGHVTTQRSKAKRGRVWGKATGAVLTAGLSLFATGLSRKEWVTHASCANCGSRWTF